MHMYKDKIMPIQNYIPYWLKLSCIHILLVFTSAIGYLVITKSKQYNAYLVIYMYIKDSYTVTVPTYPTT